MTGPTPKRAADVGLGRPPGTPLSEATVESFARHRALARYIEERPTPCTIAVHGEWGIGKTRILQEIEASIGSAPRAERGSTVAGSYYFDAWKYDAYTGDAELGLALAAQIEEHFDGIRGWWRRWRWRRSLRWLATSASATVDGYTALVPTENISPLVMGVRAALRSATSAGDRRDLLKMLRAEAKVKKELTKRVHRYVKRHTGANAHSGTSQGSAEGRVVVFVDNLDRVDPEHALHLLQTVCTLLDFEHIVVVAAVDLEVIRSHLRTERREPGGRDGVPAASTASKERFLDKMINLEYRVPSLGYDFSEVMHAQAERYRSSMPAMCPDELAPTPMATLGSANVYNSALNKCSEYLERIDANGRERVSERDRDARRQLQNLVEASGGVNPRSMDKVLQALVLTEMIGVEREHLGQRVDLKCAGADSGDLEAVHLGIGILQVHFPLGYERMYKALESGNISRDSKPDPDGDGFSAGAGDVAAGGRDSTDVGLDEYLGDDKVVGAFERLLNLHADSGDPNDVLRDVLGQRDEGANETVPDRKSTARGSGESSGSSPPDELLAAGAADEAVQSSSDSGGVPAWVGGIRVQMEENLGDQFAGAPDFLQESVTPRYGADAAFLPQYGTHLRGKNISLYRRSKSKVVDRAARQRPKLGEMSYANTSATLRFGRSGKQKDPTWMRFWENVGRCVADVRRVMVETYDDPEGARRDAAGEWIPVAFRTRPTGLPFAIDFDLAGIADPGSRNPMLEHLVGVAHVAFREAYTAWGDTEGASSEFEG